MRDKNLTYQQFNIQLTKIEKRLTTFSQMFLRSNVVITPTLLENYYLVLPRDFRGLRVLSIIQWYLPEIYHYRIWLDLKDLSLCQLNSKQKIEINLLLESKETCAKYLYETKRYSGNEIFGNILGNDLNYILKLVKFKRKSTKVIKPQRRRGYNDHGSKRPREKWLPTSDYTFVEKQLEKERKQILQHKIHTRLLKILENI